MTRVLDKSSGGATRETVGVDFNVTPMAGQSLVRKVDGSLPGYATAELQTTEKIRQSVKDIVRDAPRAPMDGSITMAEVGKPVHVAFHASQPHKCGAATKSGPETQRKTCKIRDALPWRWGIKLKECSTGKRNDGRASTRKHEAL